MKRIDFLLVTIAALAGQRSRLRLHALRTLMPRTTAETNKATATQKSTVKN